MMLLGYLYGYSEKRLCDETRMHLGFRWFCRIRCLTERPWSSCATSAGSRSSAG